LAGVADHHLGFLQYIPQNAGFSPARRRTLIGAVILWESCSPEQLAFRSRSRGNVGAQSGNLMMSPLKRSSSYLADGHGLIRLAIGSFR